jgi:plastocyanin
MRSSAASLGYHRRAMRRVANLFLAVSASIVLGALPAYAADQAVDMDDNFFSPATVTVDEGDMVTWTNVGSNIHNVTADNGSFSSGNKTPGGTYDHTFNDAGTFRYYCSIHGGTGGAGMSGRVVVLGATTGDDDDDEATSGEDDDEVSTAGDTLSKTGPAPLLGITWLAVALMIAGVVTIGLSLREPRRA